MILNPMFVAVLFLPLLGFAQDKTEPIPKTPETKEKKTDKPSYPILNQIFKTGLNQDQIKALGDHPTAEQQAAAMTPEQKIHVRKGLHEAEAKAKAPEDLEQIARGYLVLDEHQESAGTNAVRVAFRLQELEPKSSAGFSLAAGGYYQMDDFPAAARAAKEALRRNPEDPNAITLLALSRDRVGGRDIDATAIEKSFSFTKRDDPNLPIKLPVKIPGKPTPVPAMMKKETAAPRRGGPSPLLPLTVPVGVSLIGYGIYRSRQTKTSEAGLNPEPKGPPTRGAALTHTIIKAAIGATVIIGTGYLAAPYLPAVLSASGQAAPALAPAIGQGTLALSPAASISLGVPIIVGGAKLASQIQSGPEISLVKKETTNSAASKSTKRDNKLPGESDGWTKLKGNQGWRDESGRIWKKDQLHKDHWDIMDRKGKKVQEIDFEGKEIWPRGPKNRNKIP